MLKAFNPEFLTISFYCFQANPPDSSTFPFILLGNKIDIDGGNSRVVSFKHSFHFQLLKLPANCNLIIVSEFRFPRRRQRNGVLQKVIYLTLKHLQRKTIMWMLHSCLSPELRWQTSMSRICKFHNYFLFLFSLLIII